MGNGKVLEDAAVDVGEGVVTSLWVEWVDALDGLRFAVANHNAPCAVHRLAFKTLLAEAPSKTGCLAYFHDNRDAFTAAAENKIARMGIPKDRSLHINSRDLRRLGIDRERPVSRCRRLDGPTAGPVSP